jgi:hypothetical protein
MIRVQVLNLGYALQEYGYRCAEVVKNYTDVFLICALFGFINGNCKQNARNKQFQIRFQMF